jgi:hypothetical protein
MSSSFVLSRWPAGHDLAEDARRQVHRRFTAVSAEFQHRRADQAAAATADPAPSDRAIHRSAASTCAPWQAPRPAGPDDAECLAARRGSVGSLLAGQQLHQQAVVPAIAAHVPRS